MTTTTYIALLRAINVGGNKKVGMAELREAVSAMGFSDVRSLLQSGNLVFRGIARAAAAVEQELEKEIERQLGLATDFMVRSVKDWEGVIAGNPFPDAAKRDPGHLLVLFLKGATTERQVETLRRAIKGREVVKGTGKQTYVVYPDGIGTSRLTHAIIEKHLGTPATGRNWNTVLKLGALANE